MDLGFVRKITTSLMLYAISHMMLLYALLNATGQIDVGYPSLILLVLLVLYLPHIPFVIFLTREGVLLIALNTILSYVLGFVAFLRVARAVPQLRTLSLGARILMFIYLTFAVLWALTFLGILAYAEWSIEYAQRIFTLRPDILMAPSWLVSGVLHFVYLCGLVLFAVGLYRLGEELGGGSDAKQVKAGAVVLVPLGFVGATLAYVGLRGMALKHVLSPAREEGGKATSRAEDVTLPYEERREGRERQVVPMAEDGALPYGEREE